MSYSHIDSDYAGISSKNIIFYYGCEEVNDDHEWTFIAKQDDEILVQWTAKDLDLEKEKWNCDVILMAGIALFFDEWKVCQ